MEQGVRPRSAGVSGKARAILALAAFLLALAHVGLHDLSHDEFGHFDGRIGHECVLAHLPGATLAEPPAVAIAASFVFWIGRLAAEDALPGRLASPTSARDPPSA